MADQSLLPPMPRELARFRSEVQATIRHRLSQHGQWAADRMLELASQNTDLNVAYRATERILSYAIGVPPKAPEEQEREESMVEQALRLLIEAKEREKLIHATLVHDAELLGVVKERREAVRTSGEDDARVRREDERDT